MRRLLLSYLLLIAVTLFSTSAMAQTTIKGTIKSSKDVITSSQIVVKGTGIAAFSNAKGEYELKTKLKPPFTILITANGYEPQEVNITDENQMVDVELKQAAGGSSDIVVSATRAPIKILESPVSIERVSASAIRNAPASSYYDALSNVKGVDITTSSLTFKTPSTRGFNGSGNARFNQLVDGMDNQAPGLNFSAGSVIGLSELDVDNMELLPGASSALYGPGGMNGTLLINSKSPFKQQGLSFQLKQGLMNTDGKYRAASPFINWDMRFAKKITEKLAFKITSEFLHAKDWVASDTTNYFGTGSLGYPTSGTRANMPNYNGINTYGDETSGDITAVLRAIGASPLLTANPIIVSRTGYKEVDLINPNTVNFKFGGSINYKITNNVEAVLQGYFGTGNTVYTGSDRYSLRGLKVAQYKAEVKGLDWYVRAYTTQENSGESYNTTITTRLVNEAILPSVDPINATNGWFFRYGTAFLNTYNLSGGNVSAAHTAARAAADAVGKLDPKSDQFKTIFDRIRKTPIGDKTKGGLFLDKSDLYNVEGQYNLGSLVKHKVDILVGGNYKTYVLNSQATLFADTTGTIKITEAGAYLQLGKSFLNDKLKIAASGRFDKNSNFKGRFTPRATLLYKVAENNNIRLSYQTAYRFPTTQQQWINLEVGGATLVGGLPGFRDYYKFATNPVYLATRSANGTVTVSPTAATFGEFKPESLTSFELGYKGLQLQKKLLIDIYGYYGQYKDFLVRNNYIQFSAPVPPSTTPGQKIISVPINSADIVTTYGYGISVDYKLPKNFAVGINVSSDNIKDAPLGSGFNTPPIRGNVTLSNSGFGKGNRLGFSIVYKYADAFTYESDFISGKVNSMQTLDAQFSVKIPNSRSIIKIGGTNILNQYYVNAMGNPSVGGLYYVSYGFNVF